MQCGNIASRTNGAGCIYTYIFIDSLFPSHPPGTTSNRRNVGAETTIPKDDKMFSNHPENRRGMLSVINSIVSSVIQTTSELHKAMSNTYNKTLIKRILVEMFVDDKYFMNIIY